MRIKIIEKIQYYQEQKSPKIFASISKVILDNIDRIEEFDTKNYATLAKCSISSVTKFAKYLGFKGTKDLIPALIQERDFLKMYDKFEGNTKFNFKFHEIESYFHDEIIKSINFAYNYNYKNLIDLVEILSKDSRIFLVGKGANLEILNIFYNYLSKLDYFVKYSMDFDTQKKWTNHFKANDVVIVLSSSGISKDIDEIVKNAKSSNAIIINMTANDKSYVYQNAFINFLVQENEEVLPYQKNARLSFLYLVMQIVHLLKSKDINKNMEGPHEDRNTQSN